MAEDENGRWVPDPRAIEKFMADGPSPAAEMAGSTGRTGTRSQRRRRRGLRSELARLGSALVQRVRPVLLQADYRPPVAGYTPRHRAK